MNDKIIIEEKYLGKVLERIDEILEETKTKRDFNLKEVNDIGIPNIDEKGYFNKCKQTVFKCSEKINYLNEFRSNTHFGRMDLHMKEKNNDKDIVMYIGEKSINKDSNNLVYDWRSPVGNLYYMGNQEDFKYNDIIYNLKLKRQIDISDAKIKNIYDTYVYGRELNVTDNFLNKVLEEKKNRNEFTDIIKTIQSNQNNIIREDIKTNMIVQGVAGSGKTVVLLHRLSYLLYNYPNMNKDKLIFITPSKIFKSKLSKINRSLSLNTIKMITIEEYYLEKLNYYIPSLKVKNVIKDNLPNDVLSFIYSDIFIDYAKEFIKDYNKKSDINIILKNIYNDLKKKYKIKNKNFTSNKNITKVFSFIALVIYNIMNFKYYTDYNYMFIDEMQDYSYSEIDLINNMEKNCYFNYYGDCEQAILPYIKKKNINEFTNYIKKFNTNTKNYYLNENYRNSKEITNYCNKFINIKMTPMGINSDDVKEITLKEDLSNYILNNFNREYIILAKDNKIIEGFKDLGYEAYTIMLAKGLEFSKVIVINDNLNDIEKYVAYTRTLDKLYILKNQE